MIEFRFRNGFDYSNLWYTRLASRSKTLRQNSRSKLVIESFSTVYSTVAQLEKTLVGSKYYIIMRRLISELRWSCTRLGSVLLVQLVEQLANLVPDGLLRAARVQCAHEAELRVVPDDRLRLLLIRLQPNTQMEVE